MLAEQNQHPDRVKLECLLHLSTLLQGSLKINDVLNNAMKGLEESLEASDSSIYEIDYERGELFFRLARGTKGQELVQRRLRLGEGVAGWVAQTGQAKIVQDTSEEEHFFSGFDQELGYRTTSMMAAPLISKGTVLGVVQVLNKKGGGRFTAADLELLQIMANQIAGALENARLYSRLEERHQLTAEELKKTQARLIRSERLAALSGLAKGIAHQVRNPTMSIGGFARRLVEKTPADPEAVRRYGEVIVRENERLEELVGQVHFLISLEPQPAPSDLNAVVTALAAARAEKGKGLKIETRLAPNLPRLNLDPPLLQRALGEVVKNAEEAGAGRVEVRTLVRGDQVCLEVADDGPGIEPEVLSSVLDPFFSTRAANHGLGLTVAQRIIQEHRGEVEVSSDPGQGTLVVFSLPLHARPLD